MLCRLRYVKNSGITSMPIASITLGFLPLVSFSRIPGAQTCCLLGFLYDHLWLLLTRVRKCMPKSYDADESNRLIFCAPSALQNHVLGRLSINQSLMSGGSVWFIRKRCALYSLSLARHLAVPCVNSPIKALPLMMVPLTHDRARAHSYKGTAAMYSMVMS